MRLTGKYATPKVLHLAGNRDILGLFGVFVELELSYRLGGKNLLISFK
jgi:hypothetical protein